MTHGHPAGGAQATITTALHLIAALDAEQNLARVLEPLYPALRDGGQDEVADRLDRVQRELREALVDAGRLVNDGLTHLTAGGPATAEA